MMSKPVQKLSLRIGQLEGDPGTLQPPDAANKVMWRTVEDHVPLCAVHAFDLREFLPDQELRAVLDDDQIDALVVEFGLRREDLAQLYGRFFSDHGCTLCQTRPSPGNHCNNDARNKPLHPNWPAVYCSGRCAMMDR